MESWRKAIENAKLHKGADDSWATAHLDVNALLS
jgi:hypothetical protein